MLDTERKLQQELDLLKRDIETAKRYVADFKKRHFNRIREQAIIYCLERAVDVAEGCVLATESKLVTTLQILDRSMIECLLWIYWVAKSEENAKQFKEASIGEVKRLIRKGLKVTHHVVIKDVKTGKDKSPEFLESPFMKDVPQRLKIEDIAKQTGLEELYTLYGLISIFVHGNAFELNANKSIEEALYAFVTSTGAYMECINKVAYSWIVHRQLMP